ncbi:SMI1/KNR4 family protein [Actinoplanes sp. NPDC049668]|uniref:SMI1/KNR4 family protein n=1 Tax=unclassified Actinoplanes TaxID=2626549 RepID=UPI0033B55B50
MSRWDAEIATMRAIKDRIAQGDGENLWRHEPPRLGAPENALVAVEAALGVRLHADYRTFLTRCDGWSAVFQENDLFGTAELLGEALLDARELVSYLEPNVVEELDGITPTSVIPIAMSATSIDVFVSPVLQGCQTSTVIWLAGSEVERFDNFADYFGAMVRYNEEEARDLLGN